MPIGIHNPTYSLKPRKGRSWKRLRRIEIVALLESKFVSDADIAAHLGLTVSAIQIIKSTPEFLAQRIELSTGVLSMYKQATLANAEAQKDELDSMMPMALHSIKRILHDPLNPNHAKVALDLLDRNKATSKISRTEHSIAPPQDFHKENESAKALLALLDDPSPASPDTSNYTSNLGLLQSESEEPEPEVEEETVVIAGEVITPSPLDELDEDSIVQ